MSSRPPLHAHEWLARPLTSRLPFDGRNPIPGAPQPTVLQVLTCLMYKNGGSINPGGYGFMQGGGIYGCLGLSQEEAFCLMQIGNFYQGLLEAHGEDFHSNLFEAEINRVKAALHLSDDGG